MQVNLPRGPFSRLAAVRRAAAFTLALALGATAAFALVSCGGEDAKLLPGSTAAEITENLDTVEQLAGEGDCPGAALAAGEVGGQVEALEDVDPKLKQALQRGVVRLGEVVTTCEESTTEATAPQTETSSTEGTTKTPPGQEKKAEKERAKEEKEAAKEAEKAPPAKPETPAEEPTTTTPSEGGGTETPGGISPGEPAESGSE